MRQSPGTGNSKCHRYTAHAPAEPAVAKQPAAAKTAEPPAAPAAKADKPVETKAEAAPQPTAAKVTLPASVTAATFKSHWQEILDMLAKQSRSAWAVAFTTKVLDYQDEVLTLLFQSEKDVEAFKGSQGAAEVLRQVIFDTV